MRLVDKTALGCILTGGFLSTVGMLGILVLTIAQAWDGFLVPGALVAAGMAIMAAGWIIVVTAA